MRRLDGQRYRLLVDRFGRARAQVAVCELAVASHSSIDDFAVQGGVDGDRVGVVLGREFDPKRTDMAESHVDQAAGTKKSCPPTPIAEAHRPQQQSFPEDEFLSIAEDLDLADAHLTKPGVPDYEAVDAELQTALKYAVDTDQRDAIFARLAGMEWATLSYKINVAIDRGEFETALGLLNKSNALDLSDAQAEMVDKKIEEVKAQMEAAEAEAKAAAEAEAQKAAEEAEAQRAEAEAQESAEAPEPKSH